MSYNQGGYGQQAQQGYGQYGSYGQSGNPYSQSQGNPPNPYAQAEQPYGHTGNYSERPDLQHQSSSRYDEEHSTGGSYEMSNMNGRDPNRILNEVRSIDSQIDTIEEDLQSLRLLQKQFLQDTNSSGESPLGRQISSSTENVMSTYRGLVNRVKTIKQDPESGNPRNKAQVGKVERRLKSAINQAQQVDREYRQECRDQIARQYRIVRPDASDAEVQEAVDDSSNQQVFSNALISSDRRGEAQSVARRVNARHQAIQKIEKDMMELAQLFNDLEALVVQQEPAVAQIEAKGTEAADHVAQANIQLDQAVDKARAARRKKWICLGIVVLIIIIIVVVVAVAVTLTKN